MTSVDIATRTATDDRKWSKINPDDMSSLLNSVYHLHQETLRALDNLRTQNADLNTVNHMLVVKHETLQKQNNDLFDENKQLKEELTSLKSVPTNREFSSVSSCKNKSPKTPNGVEVCKSLAAQCGSRDKNNSLVNLVIHENSLPSAEPFEAPLTNQISSGTPYIILMPDTECLSFPNDHLLPARNITQQHRPCLIIPETVPIDTADSSKEELESTQTITNLQEDKLKVYVSSDTEGITLESTLNSTPSRNSVLKHLIPAKVISEEPDSPVFDKFREIKSATKKLVSSPSLFDEEEEAETSLRRLNVLQKARMKLSNEPLDNYSDLNGVRRISAKALFIQTDCGDLPSPSVVSRRNEAHLTVGCNETNSVNMSQPEAYSEVLLNLSSPRLDNNMGAKSNILTKFEQEQSADPSAHYRPSKISEIKHKSMSLRRIEKKCSKENRSSSDILCTVSDVHEAIPTVSLKRKRPVDPDETFCPFEMNKLESTHYTIHTENSELNISNSNSPAICNLDSMQTIYVPGISVLDIQHSDYDEQEHDEDIIGLTPTCRSHESYLPHSTLWINNGDRRQFRDKISKKLNNEFTSDIPEDKTQYVNENRNEECLKILTEKKCSSSAESVNNSMADKSACDIKIQLEIPVVCAKIQSPPSTDMAASKSLHIEDCSLSKELIYENANGNPPQSPLEMEDSFDRIPKANKINYAYLDVVRKQHERRQLDGFPCVQCEQWYRGLDLTEEEIKQRLKTCRHKARFQPTATPEHYWSIGFPDTQQCKERGYLKVGPKSPSRHRRKKGLQVLFESSKERMKEKKRKQQSLEQCLKLSNSSSFVSKFE